MATLPHIPLAEYLDTIYRPDREYIDGEVRERNVGLWPHSRLLFLLGGHLGAHESLWNITACMSPRLQVSPTRIRVPDLVLMRPGPQPEILTDPPLLILEILSPDDTYSDLQERCQDYRAMGVEYIWIIDPKTRSGRMCRGPSWIAADRLEIPGTPIHVNLPHLFQQIDSSSTVSS